MPSRSTIPGPGFRATRRSTRGGAEPSGTPTAAVVAPVRVGLEPVASGLTLPVAIATPPGDAERTLVVDAVGVVSAIGADGTVASQEWWKRGPWRGLLNGVLCGGCDRCG
jgi:hypothetical protein